MGGGTASHVPWSQPASTMRRLHAGPAMQITFQDRVVGGDKAQQTAIMEAAISTSLAHPNVVSSDA